VWEAPADLFAYGTLLFPDVVNVLLGRVPERVPAAAAGWRVAAVPGRVYPALVAGTSTAAGQLIRGLSRDEWAIIDAFEDDLYDLRRLPLVDGRDGWAYVGDDSTVSAENWDRDAFADRHLANYVERCRTWRRTYVPGQPT
jgi:hypothetical protein